MARSSFRKEMAELLGGLEGWRLEPQTTPGAGPLWCFLSDGKIEFSVSVEGFGVVLYVMETDEDMTFPSRDEFVAWMREHRPDMLRAAPTRADKKRRVRRFFEWE